MDGGGRAASGTAAESNAGRYGLLPSRGIRTSVCIRANCRDVQMSTIFSFLLSMASVHPCTARKACDRHDCMDAGGRVTHGTVTEGWRKVVQCRPLRAPALTRHSHVRVHQSKLPGCRERPPLGDAMSKPKGFHDPFGFDRFQKAVDPMSPSNLLD
jgi:hypothetical protein